VPDTNARAGGTVDFDQRFGTAAKCGHFAAQDEQ